MINLIEILHFPVGELYILNYKKSEDNLYHCFYSFAPSGKSFYMPSNIEDFYIDSPNFSGLIQFLNYDNNKLKEMLFKLINSILFRKNVKNCIKNFKEELIKVSPFFQFNTEYYIYDFIMLSFFETYSHFLKELNESQYRNYFRRKVFPKLLKQVLTDVFNTSKTDNLKHDFKALKFHYIKILRHTMNASESYSAWFSPSALNDIFDIKTSITENIPENSIDIKSESWQRFLYSLSEEYESVYNISPYTLTNHAKIEHIKEYKKLLQDNFRIANREKFYRNQQFNGIFKQSNNEYRNTYPILSFNQYILAEMKELWKQGCSIKLCPLCGQYYVYHNRTLLHNCDTENIDQKNNKKIKRMYKRKERTLKDWFRRHYRENDKNKKLQENLSVYESYFDDFLKYHKKIYQVTIQNQIPFWIYERFIKQHSYDFEKLVKSLERLEKATRIFKPANYLFDSNASSLKAWSDHFSKLTDLKNPLPDIYSYIKALRRHGYL